MCATEVIRAVNGFKITLPQIHKLISPIIDSSFELQKKIGSINLKEVETSKVGLWQSETCVNALTKFFHAERDVTYTLISVPPQLKHVDGYVDWRDTYFLLQINDETVISFKMNNKVSFLFSGTMITHRQHCKDGYDSLKEREGKLPFFNVACYGIERLYRHIKSSFSRVIHNK